MSHWLGSFNDLTRSTYFHLPVFSINNSMCTATESSCSYHISYWKLTTWVAGSWQLQTPNGTQTDTHRQTHKKRDVEAFTVTHNNITHWWHVYNVYPSNILCCSFSWFILSSCTSSISSHPLLLTFQTQTQEWEAAENSKGSSGFGCWGTAEWVWAECF